MALVNENQLKLDKLKFDSSSLGPIKGLFLSLTDKFGRHDNNVSQTDKFGMFVTIILFEPPVN